MRAPARIPLHAPLTDGGLDGSAPLTLEITAELLGTGGTHYRACQELLIEVLGEVRPHLTPSCTAALEVAALLTGVGHGDEVILPTFTFPSTANAFLLRGAQLRFVDARPDTMNLDETQVADMCTDRTRVLVAMHYAGGACSMAPLVDLAQARDLLLVEDAAHGLFGRYRGTALGTIGDLGAFSFHRTKNVAVGEGGALVVNRPELRARAEVLTAKGTDRAAFERGEVESYTWRDLGTASTMTELVAALLEAQLRSWHTIQDRRRAAWTRYQEALSTWARCHEVRLPVEDPEVEHAYHLFWMVLPSEAARRQLQAHLAAQGVESSYHYQPLHTSPMGQRLGGHPGACPVAEASAPALLRLPLHAALSQDAQDVVIDAVLSWAP